MLTTPWTVRWETGPEGPYRVGLAAPRSGDAVGVTALFVLGRGDSLELRDGVARRLASAGVRVVAIEHVGQGASAGLGRRPDAVHVEDFGTHVAAALREVDRLDGPAVLLGHSMGGLVALHVLAARPAAFRAAVLTSPLWAWSGGVPAWATTAVASVAVRAGWGTRLAIGERPFSPTSCVRMRGAVGGQADALLELASGRPDLVRGGSTWGWGLAASRSMQQLRRLPLADVRTDVTVVSCREDRTISLQAHHDVVRPLPHARVVHLDAGHDPFVAGDEARAGLWEIIGQAVATARPTTVAG